MSGYTPRSTPRATPRVAAVDPRYANLDDRTIALVNAGIRDRLYQRSLNLRRTFRLLDPEGRGKVTYAALVEEMTRTYQLSDIEQHCLRILVDRADYKKDGFIDFVEFCSLLKMVQDDEGPNAQIMSDSEKKRFQGQGFVDQRLSRLILSGEKQVPMVAYHPTNELGKMTIEAPFGVLGDSERMDSMIQAFLTTKFDKLRQTFCDVDTTRSGRLMYDEFRTAIKNVDRYVFDSEIDTLLAVLDKKKRGYVVIDEFMTVLGQEFLKKKAHRGAPLNPLVWEVQPKAPRAPDQPKSAKKVTRPAATTRTQALREQENKARLLSILQRDEKEVQLQSQSTPRLPAVTN